MRNSNPEAARGEIRIGFIIGRSYFGSGGYRAGSHCVNAELFGYTDNGFVSGPDAARPVNKEEFALVTAAWDDCIGDGREGRFRAFWLPKGQRWVMLPQGVSLKGVRDLPGLIRAFWQSDSWVKKIEQAGLRAKMRRVS